MNHLSEAFTDLKKLDKEEIISFIKRIEVGDLIIDFANNQHVNAEGRPLEFRNFWHMLELYYYAMYHRDIVIMGGAQIGKSVWLLISTLAMAASGMNVFYVLHKTDFRDSYVQEKVQRPLAISQEYKKYLKESVSNKVQQIQFGPGIIKFVGANSDGEMVGFSADCIIYDETDKVRNPKNLNLGMSRIDKSKHKLRRFVSNPTTVKGYIWLWYDKSDKRVYKCPCNKCWKFNQIDWFKSVVKEIKDEEGNVVNRVLRDKEWTLNSPDDIRIFCPEEGCGGILIRDPYALPEDKRPYWEATAVSERGIVGYHMPSIISADMRVSSIWQEYEDAVESPSKMADFYSMRLALPYAESGHKVTEGVLQRCVQPGYIFQIYPDCAYWEYTSDVPTIMGVDIASEHIDVIITSKEGTKERLLYVGKHNPTEGVGFLHDLVRRYNVEICAVDAVPETHTVKTFQRQAACDVWRMQYLLPNDASEPVIDEDVGLMKINRTESLDTSYRKYKMREMILPENYAEILDGSYVKEMTSLSRIQVETKQGFRNVWDGPAESDHARHADNYRSAVADILGDSTLYGECATVI